ncbi:hypothetical protein N0V90_012569 [Kalmusia sp. IMI 367209]|nr:hypothetical protein N0V90_012569 [Kalmusia sp. IMI 367209]
MPSLDLLSEEIIDRVCGILVRWEDVHTLRSISLVSKRYHRVAESRLYERVPLNYWFSDYNKIAGSFWTLHRNLNEKPHLRGYVRSLSFNCIREPNNEDKELALPQPYLGVEQAVGDTVEDFLVSILSLAPNVESLVLSCFFLALHARDLSWFTNELSRGLNLLSKLTSLELRLPPTCNILEWSQIFGHPSIENLSILGGVLSHQEEYEDIWTEKRSQAKYLKLSLVHSSAENYSTDSLGLVPTVFSRLEHLEFFMNHDVGDPELEQLIWHVSTFRGTFEREKFRRFDLGFNIEGYFWKITVTNDDHVIEDYAKKNPDLGHTTWLMDQPDVEPGNAYSTALSKALQGNGDGSTSENFVSQVQRHLKACAVAVASMTGHCQVVMWGNLYEEDLSQMHEAAKANGLAIQYQKS